MAQGDAHMIASLPRSQWRTNLVRWVRSIQEAPLPDWRASRPSSRAVWSVSISVVLVTIALYVRSLTIAPLSDDWLFLWFASQGPTRVFGISGNYHFNPVAQGMQWLVYLVAGTNPIPYHVVALSLFCVCAVLLLHVAWRLTGAFAAGVVATAVYLVNGRQYEGVIWTVTSFFQLLGLVFFLAGLLLYLRMQDEGRSHPSRRWHVVGFYACAILAILCYEPEVTLIPLAFLYRVLVLEHRRGWSVTELMERGRVWLREFGFGAVFLVGYLAFKYVVGKLYHFPQAPGLSAGAGYLSKVITIGLYQSYAPGIVLKALIPWQHKLYFGITANPSPIKVLLHFVVYLAPLALIILFAKPVYRWLALASIIVVASTITGVGYLASRYFVLFLVPSSIMWGGALVALAGGCRRALARYASERGARWERAVPAVALAPSALIFAIFAALGLQYLSAQIDNWRQASDILNVLNREIKTYSAADPGARKLVLVNLPGSLPAPAGYFEHGAYITWVAPNLLVELNNPHRYPGGIDAYNTNNDPYNFYAPTVTTEQVDGLTKDPDTLVLTYDYDTGHVVKWAASTP
jgi:hypothetical protein